MCDLGSLAGFDGQLTTVCLANDSMPEKGIAVVLLAYRWLSAAPVVTRPIPSTRFERSQMKEASKALDAHQVVATAAQPNYSLKNPTSQAPAGRFIRVAADQIRISEDSNRDAGALDDESFAQLMDSIDSTKGNRQPVLVEMQPGPDGEVILVLIAGYRRVMACKRTEHPVLAMVLEGIDRKAVHVHRLIENAHRKDLSPFERGRQIVFALAEGAFRSDSEAARSIGVDKSDLSKLIRLGQLDPLVVLAFESPQALQFKHAKPLTDAMGANSKAVLAEAERLAALEKRPSADEVIALLTAASRGGVGPSHTPSKDTVLSCDGAAVGWMRAVKNGGVQIELDLPLERKQREQLAKALESFVRRRVLMAGKPAASKPAASKPEASKPEAGA